MDISRSFGLRWAASSCQDVTSFITKAFKEQDGTGLNYIDDFRGVSKDEQMASQHFGMLCSLRECLCLKEALLKATVIGKLIHSAF